MTDFKKFIKRIMKMNTITYEDFNRVELCSGTVVKAEEFPRAQKPAYKVWVDFGTKIGTKQTSAQVTVHYTPESLIGRQVVGVVNLAPRNIAGFMSEFLLVGFSDESGAICLASMDPKVPNGQKLI
jgi:tRNA-binding protein